jgi:RNA polymerase sigma factor (sigma-70 family)
VKLDIEFEQVYKKYTPLVHRMANKFITTYRYFDREDLVQIGYIALWKAWKSYDPERESSFTTHICNCIYRAIDKEFRYFRQEKRGHEKLMKSLYEKKVQKGDKPVTYFDSVMDLSQDVESIVCTNETIQEAIEMDSKVIPLYLSGMTQVEIAEKIGCSQVNVSRRIRKCKELLEKAM